MLDKNSPAVQQQIADGIIDLTKKQYALAHTTLNMSLNETDPAFGKITTYICDRRWHDKVSAVKANRTEHLKCDAYVLKKFEERLAKDDFTDTCGADGKVVTAAFWRKHHENVIAEFTAPQRRWFIVYHDDKYVYDYETNLPIQLDQPPFCETDLTIFN